MTQFRFSTFVLICFFLFNHEVILSQNEDEMIPNNAVIHFITNGFNPINIEDLNREVDSVYNGSFYVWSPSEFASRGDSIKSENEFTLVIKVYDIDNDSLIVPKNSTECILENEKRNLTVSWKFDSLVKIDNLISLFEGFEKIRINGESNFDSMFENLSDNDKVTGKEITIELTTSGRFVQNLTDAIEASLTIDVENGHGSGFFISDSIVVTNYHVIKDQETITSTTAAGEINFEVLVGDSLLDLAILKSNVVSNVYFSLPKDELPPIDVGIDILIIGSPTSKLLTNSLSSGIISGIREFDDLTIIQTDAKINPGNSGGALLDSKGNLHGVVTAKVFGYGIEGLGFAIPTKYIIQILN